jgi:hypothetical protein
MYHNDRLNITIYLLAEVLPIITASSKEQRELLLTKQLANMVWYLVWTELRTDNACRGVLCVLFDTSEVYHNGINQE